MHHPLFTLSELALTRFALDCLQRYIPLKLFRFSVIRFKDYLHPILYKSIYNI